MSPLSDVTLRVEPTFQNVPHDVTPNGNAYARVQRHSVIAEELDFSLQSMKRNVDNVEENRVFGNDINPSVGDVSDRESELNIRQLESSLSTLSGVHEHSVSPPSRMRNVPRIAGDRRPFSPETDL